MAALVHGEIHFHLRFKFRLKFIFHFPFGCIFMTVEAALGYGEIHLNLLSEFRLLLNFSFTFGCASIFSSILMFNIYVLEIIISFLFDFLCQFFFYFSPLFTLIVPKYSNFSSAVLGHHRPNA